MKIYTKTGDQGETSLVGGTRVSKSSELLDVYGSVDELNSFVGLLISEKPEPLLTEIQQILFVIGGIVATESEYHLTYWNKVDIISLVEEIEKEIDRLSECLEPMKNFILPQGSKAISYTHICRTVCRRVERKMTQIDAQSELVKNCLIYVNRLSDYFFILARFYHKNDEISETSCKLGK